MKKSDVNTVFDSKAYRDWRKSRESQQKIDAAVINRLDAVIQSIGNLGKALTR